MKVDKAQANIIMEDGKKTNRFKTGGGFERMSHEQLIKICKGTDLAQIRALSNWFAKVNGMYGRAVRYIADINKFDYLIYPDLNLAEDIEEKDGERILKEFDKVLTYFDNSAIQALCRKIAIRVCIDGCYYGYICDDVPDRLVIQDLPVKYCRSRFLRRGVPTVEFNMKYFDDIAKDEASRIRILQLFPKEFQNGYRKYTQKKLEAEEYGDTPGWVLLNPKYSFKLNFNEWDLPPFLSGIPALIELAEIQDLEKEKLLQQIQKILVQQFDLDKNGQIPFNEKEIEQLNRNALALVGDAFGISVMSTFGSIHLEDVGAEKGLQSINNVDTAKNNVYTDLGLSTNLFNTEGNLSLEKSIIVDEAFAKPLILQFSELLNRVLENQFNKKKIKFRLKMLFTTIFNQKELAGQYKDLTKLGYSRFFPAIAMGHSQKEITSLAKLEQQIMQLDAYMLPPFSSNTMSSDTWAQVKDIQKQITQGKDSPQVANGETDKEKGGRPALAPDQKSDKTLANEAAKG